MIYAPLLRLFTRQRITLLAFVLLIGLGLSAIFVGRGHLESKRASETEVAAMQTRHIEAQTTYHPDDLGLVLYYLRFAFIHPLNPLSGLSIGQTDLNNSIQHLTILALEGQKYDTDLVSPSRQQVGHLDLSFVLVFLFPLVIIALGFNLWHEEVERGTWRIIRVQGRSPLGFLLAKLAIRVGVVLSALVLLFGVAILVLALPIEGRLLVMFGMAVGYILFWFALSLLVVSWGRTSSVNAVVLLSLWLVLCILLPVGINNYLSARYPIDDALSLTIKQRDEYHKRWDTDKQETMRRFVACYPELSQYSVPDSGFTWGWYYAMQHMGDLESRQEQAAMLSKVRAREAMAARIALLLPPVGLQLGMNELAGSDLNAHLDFLEATARFHEAKRRAFYPAIFEERPATSVDWSRYATPERYTPRRDYRVWSLLAPLYLMALALFALALPKLRRL
ncbi:MAG: DUF3526 domain-containing protein [Porphyromonas sp.]|nr:DUF3526 domain-containing protein [Porphyromonas sp.]